MPFVPITIILTIYLFFPLSSFYNCAQPAQDIPTAVDNLTNGPLISLSGTPLRFAGDFAPVHDTCFTITRVPLPTGTYICPRLACARPDIFHAVFTLRWHNS